MRTLLLFLMAMPFAAQAQFGSFEDLPLPAADTYYVNYTMPGKDVGFNEFNVHYPCVYDTAFGGLWVSGFAYSNKKDSVTSGFRNQYSAKAGGGNGGSAKYVVANGAITSLKQIGYNHWAGLYITNSTYAYNSMRDGDAFAKKFGGPTGNDPDWFKVTIRGYLNGIRVSDSIDFYLADFRWANNAQDYIVKDWRRIDLQQFLIADSLTFTLSSSDTGSFGINTPLYFCLDDVNLYFVGVANIPFTQIATISPNPASDFFYLDIKDESVKEASIMDITGRMIATIPIKSSRVIINTSTFPAGQYLLKLVSKDGSAVTKFMRQ